MDKLLNMVIEAEVSAKALNRIFYRLEDEAKPYSLNIKREGKGFIVTLRTNAINAPYFSEMINEAAAL